MKRTRRILALISCVRSATGPRRAPHPERACCRNTIAKLMLPLRHVVHGIVRHQAAAHDKPGFGSSMARPRGEPIQWRLEGVQFSGETTDQAVGRRHTARGTRAGILSSAARRAASISGRPERALRPADRRRDGARARPPLELHRRRLPPGRDPRHDAGPGARGRALRIRAPAAPLLGLAGEVRGRKEPPLARGRAERGARNRVLPARPLPTRPTAVSSSGTTTARTSTWSRSRYACSGWTTSFRPTCPSGS